MDVNAMAGTGALANFTQQLEALKARVANAPAPRAPELPPPSPVSQANKNLGRSLDVKL